MACRCRRQPEFFVVVDGGGAQMTADVVQGTKEKCMASGMDG